MLTLVPYTTSLESVLRALIASVWFVFGFVFKICNGVPRHRAIVAAVVGERHATLLVTAVGSGEVLLSLWIASGILPTACASVQTVAIVTMNALELRRARSLLLVPRAMVIANTLLLTGAWYVAMKLA